MTLPSIEQTWLDNDLHNLRWRYIHAVNNGQTSCLLVEDPIRAKLGLKGDITTKAPPPGTPSCYKRVIRVQLYQLQSYIDKLSPANSFTFKETPNANR